MITDWSHYTRFLSYHIKEKYKKRIGGGSLKSGAESSIAGFGSTPKLNQDDYSVSIADSLTTSHLGDQPLSQSSASLDSANWENSEMVRFTANYQVFLTIFIGISMITLL